MQHKGIALSSQRTAGLEQTTARHLPVPLTPLVGREQNIAAVCALLSRPEVRLVTLIGTGGVGKTRLALQVAAVASSDFADGICFVALAPLTDPGLMVSTIAQALGVRDQGSRPLLDGLKDYLQEKQLLLLLDNFRAAHLSRTGRRRVTGDRTCFEGAGDQPGIASSLRRVRVRRAASLATRPAGPATARPPDTLRAVCLFIERAQAVQSDFAITEENAAAIAAICYQVDGLPLAIELAARRSKLFSPQALLSRLENRLKLLVGGAQDLPLRQQTLSGNHRLEL